MTGTPHPQLSKLFSNVQDIESDMCLYVYIRGLLCLSSYKNV